MAHADQFDFMRLVKTHLPAFFNKGRVLEVGRLDINGSVRSMFQTPDYIGVDVGEGPGVDEVCQGQLVGYPTETFDAAISCECLEHNPYWVETVSNMFRMAKAGGLVVISCATTGRAEHGTTKTSTEDSPLSIGIGWDYYKNISMQEFKNTFNLPAWFDDYVMVNNWHNSDLYFVGIKKGSEASPGLASLKRELQKRFAPHHSFRSMAVMVAVRLFGEAGASVLRGGWRVLNFVKRAVGGASEPGRVGQRP